MLEEVHQQAYFVKREPDDVHLIRDGQGDFSAELAAAEDAGNLAVLTVRAAIAGYVLQLWNVDCSPDRSLDPTIHRLCLKNLNTIKGIRSLEIAPGFADVRLGGSPIHS